MVQARCTARKKRTEDQCGSFAMANGKCAVHGGKTPTGFALPQTKTGRYSRHLPTRLASKYEQAIADPELLALRDDIGLLDTRLGLVVAALDTGESRESWVALMAAVSSLEDQWQKLLDDGEPPEEMERTVEAIARLVRQGLSEGYVWSEIRGLLKERNDLVSSERKRLVEMQQYITHERAMLLFGAVMDAVQRHVRDPRALAAVAHDLRALAARGDGRSDTAESVAGVAAG